MLEGSPKLIAIDEEADHQIVHAVVTAPAEGAHPVPPVDHHHGEHGTPTTWVPGETRQHWLGIPLGRGDVHARPTG